MTDSKDKILNRIRHAVAQSPSAADSIPRQYRQTAEPDLQLFEDRLVDYGVRVYHCSPQQLPDTIRTALSAAGKNKLLIPSGLPSNILPADISFETDAHHSYADLDHSEGVLTECGVAVAETGSIFLRHTEAEGRRALTLIPDYHLCIVHRNQVVATVPEAIRKAAEFGRVPITTISGPSATSDIEMTRVKGVHGPRTLDVILVAD